MLQTDEFQGWIDHIWVNPRVTVESVLRPPVRALDLNAGQRAREFAPIPNHAHPSDHVPIGAAIRLLPDR